MKAQTQSAKQEMLRVALDPMATQAFEAMARELRSQNNFIKFHPSEFVSRLVRDYLNFYFSVNRDHLVACFFDSHAFVTEQASSARENGQSKNKGQANSNDKGDSSFVALMEQALVESKKITGKQRRTPPVLLVNTKLAPDPRASESNESGAL